MPPLWTMIVIGVLAALLAGTGALLKTSWETSAEQKVEIQLARAETKKANDVIVNLQATNTINNFKVSQLEADRSEERVKYEAHVRELRGKLDSSTRAALEEPERFGRIATYNNRRAMREVCRSSGGTEEACRIAIPDPVDKPPPAAKVSPPQ